MVKIRIYNTRGQLVRTLVSDVKATDSYTAVWNGTNDRGEDCTSGVYLIRMEAANKVKQTKAFLLK